MNDLLRDWQEEGRAGAREAAQTKTLRGVPRGWLEVEGTNPVRGPVCPQDGRTMHTGDTLDNGGRSYFCPQCGGWFVLRDGRLYLDTEEEAK